MYRAGAVVIGEPRFRPGAEPGSKTDGHPTLSLQAGQDIPTPHLGPADREAAGPAEPDGIQRRGGGYRRRPPAYTSKWGAQHWLGPLGDVPTRRSYRSSRSVGGDRQTRGDSDSDSSDGTQAFEPHLWMRNELLRVSLLKGPCQSWLLACPTTRTTKESEPNGHEATIEGPHRADLERWQSDTVSTASEGNHATQDRSEPPTERSSLSLSV